MDMSIPYELHGRTRQKARTRAALVEAARGLLADGVSPTVDQAAERAEIGRTTAYRYFENKRALLLATYPELDAQSLLGADPPTDTATRLEVVTEEITRQVLDHEPELRANLRVSLEPGIVDGERVPLRQGRAIRWIEDALAPLQGHMPEPDLRRLAMAIRVVIGIEALAWLTDVGKLSREEAVPTMRWSAQALLRTALEDIAAQPQASRGD